MRTIVTFCTMKNAGVAIAMAAACTLAGAADSGSSPAQPTAAERMSSAREAIKAQDWKKALFELNAAVKEEPKNADVHNLLGYANRKQAQPNLPKAFEHYKTALQLNPKHKGAHEYIGEAYLMDKKPDEAEKHLATLETLCGNKTCEEYADLAKALTDYRAKNK
jgi:Tfp pilus assembly protein PilF